MKAHVSQKRGPGFLRIVWINKILLNFQMGKGGGVAVMLNWKSWLGRGQVRDNHIK